MLALMFVITSCSPVVTSNIIHKLIMDGKTLGVCYEFDYSYFLSEHLSLGVDLSLTSGMLKKITASNGERTETYTLDENQYEGLVHMGICAQIVYTF